MVLITDDDLINRAILKHMLKDSGLPFSEATNGEECIGSIRNSKAKRIIVLLDLNMPVMDGYEVIEHIRSQPEEFNHVRLIVVSASFYSVFAKRGLTEHIVSYLEKPVEKEQLLTSVLACTV